MEYQVMPDIREKEKIVGGRFTITQTIFLAVGVVVGGLLGVLIYNLTKSVVLAIITIAIGAAPFLPFAFITIEKMGKMELFFYLWIKFKFDRGQKVFININENKRKRLIGEITNGSIQEEQ